MDGLSLVVDVRKRPVPKVPLFVVVVVCVSLCTGGFLNGIGVISSKLVDETYIKKGDVGSIYTGAFQMLTWGSLLAVHLQRRIGARATAVMGCFLVIAGSTILSLPPKALGPGMITMALGLIGWGGNHVFLTAFTFSSLFEKSAIPDGIIAGLWPFAGVVSLCLNFVSVVPFFRAWAVCTLVILVVVLVAWPDTDYAAGDLACISVPTLKHWTNPLSIAEYLACIGQLATWRYLLYVVSFAISALVGEYVGGNLGACHPKEVVGRTFMNWDYPIVANLVFPSGWACGWMITRCGFGVASLLQALIAQGTLVCMLASQSVSAAWANLFLYNLLTGVTYTMQFAFLHEALASEAYTVGLLVCLIVQGLVGFIDSPGLDPNPWGTNYATPVLVLLGLTVLLYVWPVFEWCRSRALTRAQAESDATNLLHSPS
mmetsp:Transcript_45536/g.120846  ORF Transcript_45536/g.120846 Transcript_45536/m.120846 type:complete len:429 (-) Transcript_45536:85-1371(-)